MYANYNSMDICTVCIYKYFIGVSDNIALDWIEQCLEVWQWTLKLAAVFWKECNVYLN